MVYIKKTEEKYSKLYNIILPFFILFLILAGMKVGLFTCIALFICLALIFFYDEKHFICLLYFLVPFALVFNLSPEGTSFFTYIELAFVLYHFYKSKALLKKEHVLILSLTLYIILCECIEQTIDIKRTIKFSSNLFLLSVMIDSNPDEEEFNSLAKWFIVGFVLSGFVSLLGSSFLPIIQYIKPKIELFGDGSQISRFTGLYSDPNYFSINLIICVSLSVLLYKERAINLIIFLGFISTTIFFIGYTGSKSALLMLIIPLLVYVWDSIRKRQYIGLLICCGLLLFVVYYIETGELTLFENTLKRLTTHRANGINRLSSGRYNIWSDYMRYFLSHPQNIIIGKGLGALFLNGKVAHNTYIDLIYQTGLIGTILYAQIVLLISHKDRYLKPMIDSYSIWACIIIMYFFLSQLQEFDMPFQVGLAIMCVNKSIKNPANDRTLSEVCHKQYISKYKYLK